MRWVAAIGKGAAVLVVHFGLGFDMPVAPALAVVGASAIINVGHALLRRPQRRLSERDATFTLAYDVLQLGLLLFLTGGLENPFAILMIAPVTVAATILSRRSVIFLSALAISAITLLAVEHWPLPWRGVPPALPSAYVFRILPAPALS